MRPTIEESIARVREDRRADYLFPTKIASEAVGCHPNKFGDWWRRSRDKLIELATACPAETGAELAAIFAVAAKQRERKQPP